MGKFKDLTGMRFGKWTVISRAEDKKDNRNYPITMWHCVCDCGTERDVMARSLLSGRSMSCGCSQRDKAREYASRTFKAHGDTKTRLYQIWAGMKKRCYNPNTSNYKNYGARNIAVCNDWNNDYLAFKEWALLNGYNDSLSIDRIDVNGNYEPNNCRWVDSVAQANNRRTSIKYTYNEEAHTIAEWAGILNMPYKQLYKKLHNGMSLEKIIN